MIGGGGGGGGFHHHHNHHQGGFLQGSAAAFASFTPHYSIQQATAAAAGLPYNVYAAAGYIYIYMPLIII